MPYFARLRQLAAARGAPTGGRGNAIAPLEVDEFRVAAPPAPGIAAPAARATPARTAAHERGAAPQPPRRGAETPESSIRDEPQAFDAPRVLDAAAAPIDVPAPHVDPPLSPRPSTDTRAAGATVLPPAAERSAPERPPAPEPPAAVRPPSPGPDAPIDPAAIAAPLPAAPPPGPPVPAPVETIAPGPPEVTARVHAALAEVREWMELPTPELPPEAAPVVSDRALAPAPGGAVPSPPAAVSEARTELSIGTIQVTVEETPAVRASRPRAPDPPRQAGRDAVPRDYVRGW